MAWQVRHERERAGACEFTWEGRRALWRNNDVELKPVVKRHWGVEVNRLGRFTTNYGAGSSDIDRPDVNAVSHGDAQGIAHEVNFVPIFVPYDGLECA